MLVPPERSSAVLVMTSSKSVSICNRSHARRANSGHTITIFRGVYPSLMQSFEGNLLTQRHQIILLETRDSRLSYGENPKSLSYLGLIRYRVVTDRRYSSRFSCTKKEYWKKEVLKNKYCTWCLTGEPAAIVATFLVVVAVCVDGTLIHSLTYDSGQIERHSWTYARLGCPVTNNGSSDQPILLTTNYNSKKKLQSDECFYLK